MGSSNSRHVSHLRERRDRGGYPAASREGGSASSGGSDFSAALGRTTESQARGSNGRERFHSRSHAGRDSSASVVETSTPGLDLVTPDNILGQEPGPFKGNSPVVEDRRPIRYSGADQFITSCEAAEGSSSSTVSFPGPTAQVSESARNIGTGRSSTGLVMEISAIVSPEIDFVDGTEVRPGRSIASSDSRNVWLEGHPPWIARLASSGSNSLDGFSSEAGLSQSSLQSLQVVCETTVQHHQVNEMQEPSQICGQTRHGLPTPLDVHDLERRGILSAESSRVPNHGTGDGSSSIPGTDRDGFSFQPTPASSQAREMMEEGRLVEYRHSVYSESWETHFPFHRSELHGDISNRSNIPPVSSSSPLSAAGRESRRNGGRRLWDTLTRAASHRRVTPMTVPLTESAVDSWVVSDNDHMDFRGFHIQSLGLEERRQRVRSQVRALVYSRVRFTDDMASGMTKDNGTTVCVIKSICRVSCDACESILTAKLTHLVWALQLLSNGLGAMPGFTCPCTFGGHRHGQCSCGMHLSSEESSTRASISRIIMLAEALFEVLDEIHRQSVALSRPSTLVTSLPAPDDVVDAIPIRKFTKRFGEEATRCNICLVEYEEGDLVKVLPCHHEFHAACVDKWLKEIHRVCPLCRSNVCELSSMGHLPSSI